MANRALLRDIHDLKLDPTVSYKTIKATGHIHDHVRSRITLEETKQVEQVELVKEQPVQNVVDQIVEPVVDLTESSEQLVVSEPEPQVTESVSLVMV